MKMRYRYASNTTLDRIPTRKSALGIRKAASVGVVYENSLDHPTASFSA